MLPAEVVAGGDRPILVVSVDAGRKYDRVAEGNAWRSVRAILSVFAGDGEYQITYVSGARRGAPSIGGPPLP